MEVILVIHVGFVVHVGLMLMAAAMTNDDKTVEEGIDKKDADVDGKVAA